MAWDWIRRFFGRKPEPNQSGKQNTLPEVRWIAPEENPWRVPLLDVRPVTLGMISTSKNVECATNAMSFGRDDGTSFIEVKPPCQRTITADLRFRIDRVLADGALFIPRAMEEKWAIYYHRGHFVFIRSWTRTVMATADARIEGEYVTIPAIYGALADENEEPEFTIRVLDFLLRSHALDESFPAPLPSGMEQDPPAAALWCFSMFGNRALFATPHRIETPLPENPLRTHSLLHIAVARGDLHGAEAALAAGIPIDLLAGDGLAPLHWAIAGADPKMLGFLVERGSPLDVPSVEGATPLMNAVQSGSLDKALFLLDRGADPNAADNRGFTALHRAAEMGKQELTKLLLDRGADPRRIAEGHTARSLAETRGEHGVIELLDQRLS